jgi:dolichol-phosphate mannosyltransferase
LTAQKKKFFTLTPLKSRPTLSVCIPAYNEEGNIGRTIDTVSTTLSNSGIPYEFVIANDNSKDNTKDVILSRMEQGIPIRLINRTPPGGFGRAVRSCLEHFKGDLVVIVMADMSDDPQDIVRYYHKINEGYDAVFGSRFMRGSIVTDYPKVKLLANRIGNKGLQFLFRTEHNDLTNSFKIYRAEAIRSIMPLFASHFNLTIELSLGVLVRRFSVARMPINWFGRTWGRANFRIKELGRRYLATLLKIYAERIFIHDDVIAEAGVRLSNHPEVSKTEVITNIKYEEDIDNGGGRVCGI